MSLPGGEAYDPQYVVADDRAHLIRLGTDPVRYLCGRHHRGAFKPRKGELVCKPCGRVARSIDTAEPKP